MNSILEDIKWQYKTGGIANRMIYWNVFIFLISIPLFYNFQNLNFIYPDWIAVSSNLKIVLTRPWTLLTYSFLHANLWHLISNMMILNFTGRLFLTFFTQKQFVGLYVLSALFSGLCFVLIANIFGVEVPLVGASAAIMSLLVAVTTYQPLMEFRISIFGNVKLWQVTGVVLLHFVLFIFYNTGGQIAHLSGALFGYLYMKLLVNGTDLSWGVTTMLDFFSNLGNPSKRTPFKKVHVNPKKPATPRASKIVTKDKTQQQIDEILDKISKSGYDSLSKDEKEFLFKAGK